MNICSFTTQINLFKRNGRGSIRCGLPSTRIRNQSWQYSTSGHLPPYPSLHLSQIEQGPHAPQLANCSIVDVKVILQLSSALLLPNVIAIDVRLKWWLFHHELPFSALASSATGEMYSMTDARSAGHWRRIYNIYCRRMTLVWAVHPECPNQISEIAAAPGKNYILFFPHSCRATAVHCSHSQSVKWCPVTFKNIYLPLFWTRERILFLN